MANYIRVIKMSGGFYAREFEKRVEEDNKYRIVEEQTVRKHFLEGDTKIRIIFENDERDDIMIDEFSEPDDIKKYLGPKFLEKSVYKKFGSK